VNPYIIIAAIVLSGILAYLAFPRNREQPGAGEERPYYGGEDD
jgi:hypothetical protein